jgi:hypothetical protein
LDLGAIPESILPGAQLTAIPSPYQITRFGVPGAFNDVNEWSESQYNPAVGFARPAPLDVEMTPATAAGFGVPGGVGPANITIDIDGVPGNDAETRSVGVAIIQQTKLVWAHFLQLYKSTEKADMATQRFCYDRLQSTSGAWTYPSEAYSLPGGRLAQTAPLGGGTSFVDPNCGIHGAHQEGYAIGPYPIRVITDTSILKQQGQNATNNALLAMLGEVPKVPDFSTVLTATVGLAAVGAATGFPKDAFGATADSSLRTRIKKGIISLSGSVLDQETALQWLGTKLEPGADGVAGLTTSMGDPATIVVNRADMAHPGCWMVFSYLTQCPNALTGDVVILGAAAAGPITPYNLTIFPTQGPPPLWADNGNPRVGPLAPTVAPPILWLSRAVSEFGAIRVFIDPANIVGWVRAADAYLPGKDGYGFAEMLVSVLQGNLKPKIYPMVLPGVQYKVPDVLKDITAFRRGLERVLDQADDRDSQPAPLNVIQGGDI